MPEDLKLSQIGSSPLPSPFRGLHSPGVRKHCQIIFACYFRKLSITAVVLCSGTLSTSEIGCQKYPLLLLMRAVIQPFTSDLMTGVLTWCKRILNVGFIQR